MSLSLQRERGSGSCFAEAMRMEPKVKIKGTTAKRKTC